MKLFILILIFSGLSASSQICRLDGNYMVCADNSVSAGPLIGYQLGYGYRTQPQKDTLVIPAGIKVIVIDGVSFDIVRGVELRKSQAPKWGIFPGYQQVPAQENLPLEYRNYYNNTHPFNQRDGSYLEIAPLRQDLPVYDEPQSPGLNLPPNYQEYKNPLSFGAPYPMAMPDVIFPFYQWKGYKQYYNIEPGAIPGSIFQDFGDGVFTRNSAEIQTLIFRPNPYLSQLNTILPK